VATNVNEFATGMARVRSESEITYSNYELFTTTAQLRQMHVGWAPCHQGMASRLQIEMAPDMEGSCEYNEKQTADKGWLSSLGLTTHHKK
jgi:hypothetical protein